MNGQELLARQSARKLLDALCALRTPEESAAFLVDLCTTREIEDLAQRLEVASLLDGGTSYVQVSKLTGASSTTVSRVSKCLNGPEGGYRLVLDRLRQEEH
ncbi:MAG: YerC/YecD family TrpR-related protein [Coriobacteriales bacterium]|nr:YerC/YecD family TrpR-related protein [Coriobacteriales bacterium]